MSSEISIAEATPEVEVIFENEISSEEPPMEEWSSIQLELPQENIKRLKYDQGLYDPGSGEICAEYLPLSASSVFRHVYYNYPGIKDPGIVGAILMPESRIIYPDDGQEFYLTLCNEMNLCPVRSFYRGLLDDKIDLKYYGVDPKGLRPMAMSLKLNRFVTVLDLTDNWINEDGCFHLGEMLIDNISLRELNLTGCRIGSTGARRLFHNLHLNQALKSLNLSRNDLGDTGVELLAKAIFKGADLRQLNLSFNKLSGKSPLALAEAFETNNKLSHLNMSWNSMLSPNAIFALCTQLSLNSSLEELDLSWNSLSGSRIGLAIKILLSNPKIRNLYLSNNKLEGPVIKSISVSLGKAKNLDTLDLSFNPLTTKDAILLLERLRERRVKLKRLLLDNIIVDEEFVSLHKEILSYKFRSETVVTWGMVRKKFSPVGTDIREIVFNRCEAICNKSKKKRVDIALVIQQMYRDDPEPMSVKTFAQRIRANGAQLDDDLIEEMANRFPGPKSDKIKLISLPAVIEYLKRKWPERKLPPTPPPEPEPEPVIKTKKGKNKK
ncbi:leucine-rich repeat-containing protein 74B-like [Amyelois transitella]|uniref:leucine-rich repeat-containing protein 74B-like n=1 Tax=Amyelois transitella TaxID=680683 RepID=UPI00067AEC02|nr:leucine-rich repeat-containing protein 74B-like [Amyelois transitella]